MKTETLIDHTGIADPIPAPNKAQHSPLPWNIGEDNDVFSENTDCVARVCGAPEGIKGDLANAKLIVRAVNHADKLAKALRKSADTFNDLAKGLRLLRHGTMAHACDIAEQATRETIAEYEAAQ